jgi:hypothetical protein
MQSETGAQVQVWHPRSSVAQAPGQMISGHAMRGHPSAAPPPPPAPAAVAPPLPGPPDVTPAAPPAPLTTPEAPAAPARRPLPGNARSRHAAPKVASIATAPTADNDRVFGGSRRMGGAASCKL